MGIGFGRGHGRDGSRTVPARTRSYNIATIAAPGRDGESAQGMRRGYIVTRRGDVCRPELAQQHISRPSAMSPSPARRSGTTGPGFLACIMVNGAAPARAAGMLMIPASPSMYLDLPARPSGRRPPRRRARLHARARHQPDDLGPRPPRRRKHLIRSRWATRTTRWHRRASSSSAATGPRSSISVCGSSTASTTCSTPTAAARASGLTGRGPAMPVRSGDGLPPD